MAKKNKGIIFLLLGCILLLVAGGWYLYNVLEDKNAGQQAAVILSRFDDGHNGDTTPPVITVDGDTFCGKLVIEKLGMVLPVYDEWDYARLKTAPCRYTGHIATDDMIIAAHNYKSHFGKLDKLQAGDEITFVDACGTTYLYEVSHMSTLDGTAVSDMVAGGWDLTLFTCTKSGEQRVTVRCERKE